MALAATCSYVLHFVLMLMLMLMCVCARARFLAGDTHLGGEDFDMALMDWVISDWKKKNKAELAKFSGKPEADGRVKGDPTTDKRAMRRLRSACERAKCMLSSTTVAQIDVETFHEGIDLAVTITRAKFEELVRIPSTCGTPPLCLSSLARRCLPPACRMTRTSSDALTR